jgi:hypothetical protein
VEKPLSEELIVTNGFIICSVVFATTDTRRMARIFGNENAQNAKVVNHNFIAGRFA